MVLARRSCAKRRTRNDVFGDRFATRNGWLAGVGPHGGSQWEPWPCKTAEPLVAALGRGGIENYDAQNRSAEGPPFYPFLRPESRSKFDGSRRRRASSSATAAKPELSNPPLSSKLPNGRSRHETSDLTGRRSLTPPVRVSRAAGQCARTGQHRSL